MYPPSIEEERLKLYSSKQWYEISRQSYQSLQSWAQAQCILKEAATLLELAQWKANLDDDGERNILQEDGVQETQKRQKRVARTETCIVKRFAISISPIGMRKKMIRLLTPCCVVHVCLSGFGPCNSIPTHVLSTPRAVLCSPYIPLCSKLRNTVSRDSNIAFMRRCSRAFSLGRKRVL